MRKKIYALATAALLTMSMSALAGETKSCDKKAAETCCTSECKTEEKSCKKDEQSCSKSDSKTSCDRTKCEKPATN